MLILGFVLLSGGGSDESSSNASSEDHEVLLESAASAGRSPFTPSLQPISATSPTTTTTGAATTTTVPSSPSGRVAQGPFGGTGDNSLCDRELLVQFLTDPANAGTAREWARVLNVRVVDIPTYVRSLIPTTLTSDARVTNHRWENGRVVGYQAVLERGTAVLVDTKGNLIARCRCGNPLLPPVELASPVYIGPRWAGFDPQVIIIVVPSPTPIFPPGGAGTTTPRATTTTTRPSTTTTARGSADQAAQRIRSAFEPCARADASSGFFTPAEIETLLASIRYVPTVVDQRTGTYRVQLVGVEGGGSATWEVNLTTGEVTPVDATAQEVAAECPALA